MIIVVNSVLLIKTEKGGSVSLIPKYIIVIEHSKNILQAQNLLKEKEDQIGLCERSIQNIWCRKK